MYIGTTLSSAILLTSTSYESNILIFVTSFTGANVNFPLEKSINLKSTHFIYRFHANVAVSLEPCRLRNLKQPDRIVCNLLICSFISQVPSHRWLTVAAAQDYEDEGVTIRVIPDQTTIRTGSLVGIFCSWTPGSRIYGVVTVGGVSIWEDHLYGPIVQKNDTNLRVFSSSNDAEGIAGFVMKNVSEADARNFSCCVSRLGCSETITLKIEEGGETETTEYTTKRGTTGRFTTRLPTWFTTDILPRTTEEATEDSPTSDHELDLEFGGLDLKLTLEKLRRQWSFQ